MDFLIIGLSIRDKRVYERVDFAVEAHGKNPFGGGQMEVPVPGMFQTVIEEAGVQKGAVRRDADHIVESRLFRRQNVAGDHVVHRTADHGHVRLPGQIGQSVVGG